MKKNIFTAIGLLLGISAWAHNPGHVSQVLVTQEEDEKVRRLETYLEDQGIYSEISQPGIKLGGYVDVSYVYNFNGGGVSDLGEANAITGEDSQDFNLNQINLTLSKALPADNKWAAGFAISLNWGEDVESHHGGGDEHGHADALSTVHEAIVQFRVPVGRGLDFSLGKWHSLMSYESHDREPIILTIRMVC
ncbi:MAG: outer membrane beta-barrel protein [Verrucomicrobiia bacterium]